MPFVTLRAPFSQWIRHRRIRLWLALFCVMASLASSAQTSQVPSHSPKPLILPEANPVPDANQRMIMHDQKMQQQNFNAANAERLKQLMQATEMLETMAMALKAEVEKSGDVSPNTLHKADTIERLARIVKERMSLTITPR